MTHHQGQDLYVAIQQKAPIALTVQLECKAGEMLALIGPSGSGKSTVLRTIAGLHSVPSGTIRCGSNLWLDTEKGIELRTQARCVGMVFQHYALFPHKSALDNVALAINGKSRADKRKRAMEWLERTNMTGLEHRKPSALSGGQRQRVALARALARNPSALLLDEPFSAVDQQTRRRLYRELAKLRSGLDIPMILVTHDIHEVQQLADSLCLIHRGTTLQQGPVQDVINAPNSKAVARLLGHQNLMAAQVVSHDNTDTLYQIGPNEQLRGPRAALPIGAAVTLLVAPTAISIRSETDATQNSINVLRGSITDAVGLGDEWSLRVHLDTVTKSLRFRVPFHLVDKPTLTAGTPLQVSILPSGIHAISD